MKKTTIALYSSVLAAIVLIAGCATSPSADEVLQTLKASFSERGIAKLDRLEQSELQRLCSQAAASGQALDEQTRERLQKTIYESIPYPADGQYIGDWREGEKIAQNGRGLQWSDVAGAANGANCYACHQLSPQEISFGNMGPSLLKYGVTRGVKDPNAVESEAIVKYTWGRIWNTHAFNACSGMPRFGDAGILTPAQIKHVMALLLDPDSPVNK
ncbi:MAG: sulfur oxidation c-type cytochrome SoxX [Burkholderiaceae bacterium]